MSTSLQRSISDLRKGSDACFLGLTYGMAAFGGQDTESLRFGLSSLNVVSSEETIDLQAAFEPTMRALKNLSQISADWFQIGFMTVQAVKVSNFEEPLAIITQKLDGALSQQGVLSKDRGEISTVIAKLGQSNGEEVNAGKVFDSVMDLATLHGKEQTMSSIRIENNHGIVSGDGSSFTDTRLDQRSISAEFDFKSLSEELAKLRVELQKSALETTHFKQLAAVAEAEEAVQEEDGGKLLGALKNTGQWSLETAQKVGVPVAVEAIKRGLGWNG